MSDFTKILEQMKEIDLTNMTYGETMFITGIIGAILSILFLIILIPLLGKKRRNLLKKIEEED